MPYHLGSKSKAELEGVHPALIKVVERAIKITTQDFSVHDGLRTVAEQKRYVARGVSKTMNSQHIKQGDGYGHAVDLVPYINGKLRWEWNAIYPIAEAVKQAAEELDVEIRWGGCWQTINDSDKTAKQLVRDYGDRKRRAGKRSFPDGPHFELTERW